MRHTLRLVAALMLAHLAARAAQTSAKAVLPTAKVPFAVPADPAAKKKFGKAIDDYMALPPARIHVHPTAADFPPRGTERSRAHEPRHQVRWCQGKLAEHRPPSQCRRNLHRDNAGHAAGRRDGRSPHRLPHRPAVCRQHRRVAAVSHARAGVLAGECGDAIGQRLRRTDSSS